MSLLLLAVLFIAITTNAQRCLEHMCGRLHCPMINETGCPIQSQDDCAGDEVYLYPGLICECCGTCLSRTVRKYEISSYRVKFYTFVTEYEIFKPNIIFIGEILPWAARQLN